MDEKNIRLDKFGKKEIPENLIIAGEIKKKEELKNILKDSFKNIDIKYVISSLPEERAFLRVIELPQMDPRNIRASLEAQLEEYIPLAVKDAIFDFEVLSNSKHRKTLDIVIVAFPREIVFSYKEVLVKAGLKPLIFELESWALARGLLKENDNTTKMIIDFGRTRVSFAIICKNKVQFTSTIKASGDDLDRAIARSFSVDMAEAEKIKKTQGLIRAGKYPEVYSVILPVISAIKEEIERHFSYWQTHYAHAHGRNENFTIQEVILCGGDANLLGLAEYLSFELDVPVKKANVWLNIASFEDYVPEIDFNESLTYSTVMGLALKGLKLGWI
jgi:type IV pilus assembly protein PilM